MLNVWQLIFLGAVQGLTEFIPVSSSGHLEIVPKLFGWSVPSTNLMLFAHFGTLLALLVFFRKDLAELIISTTKAAAWRTNIVKGKLSKEDSQNTRLVILIILACVPAGILGLLFDKQIVSAFYDQQTDDNLINLITLGAMAAVGLIFILTSNSFRKRRIELVRFPAWRALLVGASQVLAFVRGVSRSGITILAGQFLGLNRVDAARFAFLVSIPLLMGSSLLAVLDLRQLTTSELNAILPQAIVILLSSFAFGLLAIRYLLKYLQHNSLAAFGWYRIIFAAVAALLLFAI